MGRGHLEGKMCEISPDPLILYFVYPLNDAKMQRSFFFRRVAVSPILDTFHSK